MASPLPIGLIWRIVECFFTDDDEPGARRAIQPSPALRGSGVPATRQQEQNPRTSWVSCTADSTPALE